MGKVKYEQGYIYGDEGNYEDARRVADEALNLYKKVLEKQQQLDQINHQTYIRRTLAGDPVDLGRAHQLLGMISNGAGQSNDALMYYNTALTCYEQYDYQREIAIVCCNLGDLYIRSAKHELAHAVLRRSLILTERIGDGAHFICSLQQSWYPGSPYRKFSAS